MDIQTVDTRPGNYYVSAVDGKRTALLLGPYPTHAEALAMVEKGNKLAQMIDQKAFWYAYGTVRVVTDNPRTGILMRLLMPDDLPADWERAHKWRTRFLEARGEIGKAEKEGGENENISD